MSEPKYTYDITVRFFDLDANNHVNNSVYFTYMEEARTKLLLEHYLKCKEEGINFVVVEASCNYKRSIGLQDKVTIKMVIENIKTVSFDIHFTFINDAGVIYAEGKTRMACVNSQTQRPVRLPKEIIEHLS